MQTFSIPSVIEANPVELTKVSADLINGLKIFHDDGNAYIVGNLAIREGVAPHKSINSSPSDKDYNLLAKAALLIASKKAEGTCYVTTGFPFLNYQLFRQQAIEFFQANHTIRYDASTFSTTGLSEQVVNVVKAMVIPELQGCDIAIRSGELKPEGCFFLVSIGYGTFEAAFSTPEGLVQRTAISGPGVRYAVTGAVKELLRTQEVGLKAEHQFDQGFNTGKIVLNRNTVDLTEIRKKYLQLYYTEVISSLLANAFADKDFSKCKQMILTGGGALYTDLVEHFEKEFGNILSVKVQPDPTLSASQGFCIHSKTFAEGYNAIAVGIDIGNANTVVSVNKDGMGTSNFSIKD
jgi:hypothetical protein